MSLLYSSLTAHSCTGAPNTIATGDLRVQFPHEGFPYFEAMEGSPRLNEKGYYSSTSGSIGDLSDVNSIDDDLSEQNCWGRSQDLV